MTSGRVPTVPTAALTIARPRWYPIFLGAWLAILTVLVALGWPPLDQFDLTVELAAHQFVLDNPAALTTAEWVTLAGDSITINVVVATAVVILLLRRHVDIALALLFARVGSLFCETAMKQLLHRARPVWEHPLAHASSYSFPSGHTTGAAAVYGLLILLAWATLPRVVRLPTIIGLLLLIMAVGASRVLLGVHYCSDVIGGLFLGFTWALGASSLVALLPRRRRPAG